MDDHTAYTPEGKPLPNLAELVNLKHETPETFRHGDIANKFKYRPREFFLQNPDDLTIDKLLTSLSKTERLLVPVISDYIPQVLVEPNLEDQRKPHYRVETGNSDYTFIRLERQHGVLEIFPLNIQVKHEEDLEGNLNVSAEHWVSQVRGQFHPYTTLEHFSTDNAKVAERGNRKYENLTIISKGTGTRYIEIDLT